MNLNASTYLKIYMTKSQKKVVFIVTHFLQVHMHDPLTAQLQSAALHSMHISENVLAVILPHLTYSIQFIVRCF